MTASRNTALVAWRTSHRLSQDELARKLGTTSRNVQRWESGRTLRLHAAHARALEQLTGLSVQQLGFPADVDAMVVDDGRGGHDLEVRQSPAPEGGTRLPGDYSGIWLSRYEYYSSTRANAFTGLHHVALVQAGDHIDVASLEHSSPSAMTMDLHLDGNVVTGSWRERTDPNGHYRGAVYFGALQMLVEPSGRRISGKWVGFGSDGDVNTGPWRLDYLDASTPKTRERYDRPPEQ